ncbi:hypothetical protein SDC9_68451 [bioreactor metagenome]|uniref:DUF523 domain-containing protein n=1 Tax=bioreactor metagenome TaxID=1076179 RepID=A0A644Y253_9ZZZZ|nr:hypothetical protein [Christensenella sp.]
MQKILFVAHCVLNTASKVVMYNSEEMAAEEALRRRFLTCALEKGVQLVQLPCPEFLLYGSRRWGHVSDQFDTPYFRRECRTMLSDILLQLKEYRSNNERFEIIGIIGIDGSPSCGVDYSCVGNWGGNLSDRDDLAEVIASARLTKGSGIMMQELAAMLKEEGIHLPMTGLFAGEPEKVMSLLK